jgi:hypothetical protein
MRVDADESAGRAARWLVADRWPQRHGETFPCPRWMVLDSGGIWIELIGRVLVGLTATWAVTPEPDRFAARARDGIAPLLDWSPTEDAGNGSCAVGRA